MTTSQEIRLTSRPDGMPEPKHFECAAATIPEDTGDAVLVRNLWMSVDPYMRGRMMDRASYVPPFEIGKALQGGAIGEVVRAGASDFKEGDKVMHMLGWREYAVAPANTLTRLAEVNEIPLQSFLGVLGMPGLTAYAGLLRIAALQEGETVFVSAAGGAVGSVVCQIAKAKNCTVIGSCGDDAKAQWLKDKAGVDEVINYKTCGDLTQALMKAAPKGIDVYFENVGGEHLQAAIEAMRPNGRIACCGMIAQYNATKPEPGPNNLIQIVGKGLRMQGFIVSNHFDLQAQFLKDMSEWIKAGKMQWQETIYEGIDKAPQAFIDLFSGKNIGKMLVRLA